MVLKAVPPVDAEPAEPPMRARAGDTHFLGHMSDRTAGEDTLDQDPPTVRSQAGITVGHEDPLVVGCVW